MYELRLRSQEDAVDGLSDALLELGALSVSVEDAYANTDEEQAIFGEPGMSDMPSAWKHAFVTALFDSKDSAYATLDMLQKQHLVMDFDQAQVQEVPDQDWVRITQSQFEPVDITPDFYIVPSWCVPPKNAKQVIRLDPGLAFGTGTHPTTRMCLKWIASQEMRSTALGRTLDYGCGSGILAIAASKYGASSVDAVDIDPAAVITANSNAKINNVEIQCGATDLASGTYNTVLANILASPLKVLAPLLSHHVADGGHLVLSGILERQVTELQEAYAPYLQLGVLDCVDGWVLLGA